MNTCTAAAAPDAKPSMTSWEREGFDTDLAFAAKWIASGDPAMRQRGEDLQIWVAEQVALYA